MIIYLTRRMNGLFPVDSVELSKLHGLGEGTLKAVITKPRNVGHHRKYWALLNMVFDNLPHEMEDLFKTVQDLHTEMKLQTGHYTEHHTIGGKVTFQVKSINFSSMDQIEFESFYDRCLDVIIKYIIPNMSKEEIINSILDF